MGDLIPDPVDPELLDPDPVDLQLQLCGTSTIYSSSQEAAMPSAGGSPPPPPPVPTLCIRSEA